MRADLTIIDSMIYSKMKNHITDKIGTKYSLNEDNFSTVSNNPTPAKFPFIHFKLISALETSSDLEATTLKGGLYTYQITVFDNVSQNRVKEVMDLVTESMKGMAFKSASLPIFADSDTPTSIARWQRYIDDGDVI